MELVVDKAAAGQVFLQVLQFSLTSFHQCFLITLNSTNTDNMHVQNEQHY